MTEFVSKEETDDAEAPTLWWGVDGHCYWERRARTRALALLDSLQADSNPDGKFGRSVRSEASLGLTVFVITP